MINAVSMKQAGKRSKFQIDELYNSQLVLASPFLSTEKAKKQFSQKQLDKLNDLVQQCSG